MASEVVKRAIEVFYPVEDTKDAWNKVVLEWLDSKTTKLEENVMEFERKYGTEFTEFDDRIKREGASFEEEDDCNEISTYPHHKHENDKIKESTKMDIDRVLEEIENFSFTKF